MTTPLASPTLSAEATFLPKKSSSSAIAFGSCQRISSPRVSCSFARRCSVRMRASVSITPPSSATIRLPDTRTTPKPVLAVPGSIPMTITPLHSRTRGGCPLSQDAVAARSRISSGTSKLACTESTSSCSSRASISRRSALAHLDGALRLQRDLRGLDLDSGLLERRADGAEIGRGGGDLEQVAVLADVLGAGVDRGHPVVLAVAVAVHQDHSPLLELPGDRSRLAEAAPVPLERVPDLGAGAVAVVGQRLDHDRGPDGAVC